MNSEFWRGRKVLITGHTGFKGSWLAAILARAGAKLRGIAQPPATSPNHFDLIKDRMACESLILDVREFEPLIRAVREFRPEVVFHLAAQSLVRESYRDPLGTYATNVMGTVNLLEACRGVESLKAVVVVTSDKCYENRGAVRAFSETDRLGGHDPYSSSKACAELATQSLRDSFWEEQIETGRAGIASARAGNVIGGGDWSADRILPDLARAFASGEPARIRNPHAVRPFQHVLDPLAGYLLLAEKLIADPKRFSGAWNFGPLDGDGSRSVSDILQMCAAVAGSRLKWTIDPGPHPHEAPALRLDCEKARRELGWRPVWDVERAVTETFRWYQKYYEAPEKAVEVTIEQIGRFGA